VAGIYRARGIALDWQSIQIENVLCMMEMSERSGEYVVLLNSKIPTACQRSSAESQMFCAFSITVN
jgi:hypothetical protein